MLKKLLRGLFELTMLAGLLYAIPQAVRAGAEGSLALVGIDGLTVTVDQEVLCSPCMGTIHWGDAANSETVVYPDDNTTDQSFTYAQAGCYEPVLTVHNDETLEEASYSAGKLPVGDGASCPVEAPVLRYFPQIIHQEPPTPTPTLTPTITPTPTVTPTADSCPGDPLRDPSFEQRCGWEFSGILDPWYTRSPRKAGERSLGLGVRPGEDDDIAGYSQAYQWVTIPEWADTLKGYYYSESEESGATAARPPELGLVPRWNVVTGGDRTTVYDRAVDTDTVFLYLSRSYDDDIRRVIWKPNYDHPSWQSFETDISFLRGQTILLIFGLGTDGDGRASRVYFDDFSVR